MIFTSLHTPAAHTDTHRHVHTHTHTAAMSDTTANPNVTVASALRDMDAMGMTRAELIVLSDFKFYNFAEAMLWPRDVATTLRERLRASHSSSSGGRWDSSGVSAPAVGVPAPSSAPLFPGGATSGISGGPFDRPSGSLSAGAGGTAAFPVASTPSSAGSSGTGLRISEAELAALRAAAAVGTATRAKAAEADAARRRTFDHVLELKAATATRPEELRAAVRKLAAQGMLQVCFVMDGTGSMAPHLSTVKDDIVRLSNDMEVSTHATARFALVVYRDYEDGSGHIELFDFRTAAELSSTLSGVSAYGGGDACEDCFGGLHAAMTKLTWQAPGRVILWIGDAPNHGRRYNGGHNDNHADKPLPFDGPALAREAQSRAITTMFLQINDYTRQMIEVLRGEYSAAEAELHVAPGTVLNKAIFEALKRTATATHTRAPAAGGGAGPCGAVALIPLVACLPSEATWGAEVGCTVLTARPSPDAADPFEALLADPHLLCHSEGRTIQVSKSPFAKGELRYAYHCRISKSERGWFAGWSTGSHVVKIPIKSSSLMGVRQIHMQTIARFLANEFNARVRDAPLPHKKQLFYVPVQLVEMKGQQWMLEPYVSGVYLKYNNNNGAVIESLLPSNPIPQAFSHFTYEFSRQRLLVCDIQGVMESGRYCLTDPAIHTVNPEKVLPDDTNWGLTGMAAFFKTHECNSYCKHLGLPDRRAMGEGMLDACPSVSCAAIARHSAFEL